MPAKPDPQVPMHRYAFTKLSDSQIGAALGKVSATGPVSASPLSDRLKGQSIRVYWLEEACNGTLGTIVINMRTMHDAGIGYHCGTEGLSMSQVGAHARHAGLFDVQRFFPTTKG